MSFLLRLQRFFVPKEQDPADETNGLPDLEDNQPFVFGQHLRIVTAIIIAFVSALFMWWIVA